LVSTAKLVQRGLPIRDAAVAAIVGPLTDEPAIRAGLLAMVDTYLRP
jgi:nitric oxide reductase NorQ protein